MSLRRFVDKTRKDRDLAEEIESHLAHEQDSNIARGLDSEQARRQAHLRFGNPRTTRERVWRYRSIASIDDLWPARRMVRVRTRHFSYNPYLRLLTFPVCAGL